MKATKLGATLGCVLAAMAACSPNEASTDGGSTSHDAGRDAGRFSLADAGCSASMALILGPACATCIRNNCQDQIASCSFDECTQCLLGCTTCTSACSGSSSDAGVGGDDGGVPSDSDGGAPSCERIRTGNCCSLVDAIKDYIDLGTLGTQCQQLADTNNEGLCANLLKNSQNFFGFCK